MSFSHIFIVKPSGYWGANRSIRQIGTKKVAIKESEAIATIILSILVSLFICLLRMGRPSPALEKQKTIYFNSLQAEAILHPLHE